MWIVMIKSLRYYIKSLCIKKCHTLMKFRIPIIYIPSFEVTYQSTTNRYLYSRTNFDRIYGALLISFLWQFLTLLPRIICNKV